MSVYADQLEPQIRLLYLDGITVFLFAGLWIASKMKASVLILPHLLAIRR